MRCLWENIQGQYSTASFKDETHRSPRHTAQTSPWISCMYRLLEGILLQSCCHLSGNTEHGFTHCLFSGYKLFIQSQQCLSLALVGFQTASWCTKCGWSDESNVERTMMLRYGKGLYQANDKACTFAHLKDQVVLCIYCELLCACSFGLL